jgi:hypothetical protein
MISNALAGYRLAAAHLRQLVAVLLPIVAAAQWQQVLWRCDATSCRRQVLDKFPTTFTREVMAVATDRRVFIAHPERVLLLSAR